eukprot:3060358-Pyramimonas_sp.AAC.2
MPLAPSPNGPEAPRSCSDKGREPLDGVGNAYLLGVEARLEPLDGDMLHAGAGVELVGGGAQQAGQPAVLLRHHLQPPLQLLHLLLRGLLLNVGLGLWARLGQRTQAAPPLGELVLQLLARPRRLLAVRLQRAPRGS